MIIKIRSQNEKVSKLIKNYSKEFVMASVAQIIYLGQTLVQNKIFTRFFATSVYGEWSLLMSVYTLVSMIPFTAIDQGIYRISYQSKKNGLERELYSFIGYVYFSGFFLYSFLFIVLKLIQNDSFFANGYGVFFCGYAFSEILKNTYVAVDNAYRNRKRVLYIRIFGFTSRTVLLIIAYFLNIFTIRNVLLILIVTNVIILVYQKNYFPRVFVKLSNQAVRQMGKEIVSFSAPLLSWAIFGWLQNMISRWYLDALLDLEAVAMYSVLTSTSYFVPSAIYGILNAYVMPVVFSSNKPFYRKKLLLYLGGVGAAMCFYWLFISIFGGQVILLLSSTQYVDMAHYLPMTTASSIIYVLAMLSTVEIYRQGKTSKLLLSNIIPGALMATVGYFLIKQFGMNGAVANYMMGHIVYSIMVFCVTIKYDAKA